MIKQLLPLAIVAALMISGCDNSPTDNAKNIVDARKTASKDISQTREDATKTMIKAQDQVASAQQKYGETDQRALKTLTAAESDAMTKTANAAFDVAKAGVEGRYNIEKEKCGILDGAAKDACLSTANTVRTEDLARATKFRDDALLSADYHK